MAGNLRPASRKEDGLGFYFDRDLEITSELQNQRVVAGTAKIINFKSMSRQEILPMEHQSSPTKARPLKSHDWPSSQMLESSTSPCSSQRYSENAQEYAGKKSTLSTRDPLYHLAHNLDVVLHKSLKSSSQQNEDASNQLANPRELVSAGYHCPQRLKAKPLQALPLNALPSHAASDDTYFYHLKETCSETVPVQRASSPTLATQVLSYPFDS